jgi:SAM-dependent methyltransferase
VFRKKCKYEQNLKETIIMTENTNEAVLSQAPPKSIVSGGCCGSSASSAPIKLENRKSTSAEEIKKQVQSHYAGLVSTPSAGCCGSNGSKSDLVTKLAGYDAATLDALPEAAVEKSFGCGHPLQFAGVQPGQTVLDIGSGAGIDCFIASKKVGPTGKVIGLDMTPAMLETARRNAREGGYTNVEFRQGDAENMPLEDSSVDWVISNCVINLAPDKRKVFAEINRVLKPGGRISISDIVADALPDIVRRDSLAYCGCVGGAITTDEFVSWLTQAGMVDVRIDHRLDYEPSQIAEIVLGDQQLNNAYGDLIKKSSDLVKEVKVASVKVVARKPESSEKPYYQIEPLAAQHLPNLRQLLRENNLPLEGLQDSIKDAFVATQNGFVIGAITLERYGDAGLLRSFVVANGWRGRGLGKALGGALLKHASATGIHEVFLLTNTIKDMAAHFGFQLIQREEVPAAVRESVEFRLQQCDTAVAMKLELPSTN